jgi:hypothetical protein
MKNIDRFYYPMPIHSRYGSHSLLRTESFELIAYRDAGYPLGKSVRGLKKWSKRK